MTGIVTTRSGLGRRLVAGTVDLALICAGGALGLLGGPAIAGIVGVVLLVIVSIILPAGTGRSPGKRLMGIRVAHLDGSSPSHLGGLVRLAALIITAPITWLFVCLRRDGRGLHDFLASTQVILDAVTISLPILTVPPLPVLPAPAPPDPADVRMLHRQLDDLLRSGVITAAEHAQQQSHLDTIALGKPRSTL